MTTSDGSTADYYELPAGATQLQDLISHRNLNAQDGEIFRAIYRKGRASHSDELRDARKVLFYAQAEVKRLEKLAATPTAFGQQNMIDPAEVDIESADDRLDREYSRIVAEPASAIDDDSERMQAIGQNGEMAAEVYAAVDQNAWANCELESLTSECRKYARDDTNGFFWSERGRKFNMNRWRVRRWLK